MRKIGVFVLTMTCIFIVTMVCICVTRCASTVFQTENQSESDASAVMETTIEEETAVYETETEETPVLKTYPIDETRKFVGVYINDPQDIEKYGSGISIMAWFDTFQDQSDYKLSLCLDDHLYTAFITLDPEDMSLDDIAEGTYDDEIVEYLKNISYGDRINTQLFVRFAHEMEMRPTYSKGWYSWQGTDYEAYIAAWQHVVSLGRKYAPNVKWVWSPNRADIYTKNYYPGDDFVDYVSLSLNNVSSNHYETFYDLYSEEGTKDSLESYGKPIIFGEVAESCSDETKKNDYIMSVFDFLEQSDNVIGVVFFDKNTASDRQFKFSDDETILNNFIKKAMELNDEKTF